MKAIAAKSQKDAICLVFPNQSLPFPSQAFEATDPLSPSHTSLPAYPNLASLHTQSPSALPGMPFPAQPTPPV